VCTGVLGSIQTGPTPALDQRRGGEEDDNNLSRDVTRRSGDSPMERGRQECRGAFGPPGPYLPLLAPG